MPHQTMPKKEISYELDTGICNGVSGGRAPDVWQRRKFEGFNQSRGTSNRSKSGEREAEGSGVGWKSEIPVREACFNDRRVGDFPSRTGAWRWALAYFQGFVLHKEW